jgi:hypothetical protein
MMMVAIKLSSFEDVRMAREWVGNLARVAGIHDPGAAVQTAAELGNNCVEHGSQTTGMLWVGCGQGRLSLQFENECEQRPDWQTQKPALIEEYRAGGYGLQIARALARSVNCRWAKGRVIVRAEFE